MRRSRRRTSAVRSALWLLASSLTTTRRARVAPASLSAAELASSERRLRMASTQTRWSSKARSPWAWRAETTARQAPNLARALRPMASSARLTTAETPASWTWASSWKMQSEATTRRHALMRIASLIALSSSAPVRETVSPAAEAAASSLSGAARISKMQARRRRTASACMVARWKRRPSTTAPMPRSRASTARRSAPMEESTSLTRISPLGPKAVT
mmetsp:Transcript_5701/g.17196  ORF Transcript_5701/g.17196 Transcript_5701/m.17196 type:complete len:217 (-) Transcript_5701:1992-2642(-)